MSDGRDGERAGPLRPEQPLLAGDRVRVGTGRLEVDGMAPALCAPSITKDAPLRAGELADRATGRTAPVVHRTCETATRRVRGVIAASIAASVRASSPPSPMSA